MCMSPGRTSCPSHCSTAIKASSAVWMPCLRRSWLEAESLCLASERLSCACPKERRNLPSLTASWRAVSSSADRRGSEGHQAHVWMLHLRQHVAVRNMDANPLLGEALLIEPAQTLNAHISQHGAACIDPHIPELNIAALALVTEAQIHAGDIWQLVPLLPVHHEADLAKLGPRCLRRWKLQRVALQHRAGSGIEHDHALHYSITDRFQPHASLNVISVFLSAVHAVQAEL